MSNLKLLSHKPHTFLLQMPINLIELILFAYEKGKVKKKSLLFVVVSSCAIHCGCSVIRTFSIVQCDAGGRVFA